MHVPSKYDGAETKARFQDGEELLFGDYFALRGSFSGTDLDRNVWVHTSEHAVSIDSCQLHFIVILQSRSDVLDCYRHCGGNLQMLTVNQRLQWLFVGGRSLFGLLKETAS